MLDKSLFRTSALALAVGAFTLGAAQAPATAGQTLRYTTQLPGKNFATKNANAFIKCVADSTDINIEMYDSAQLYKDKEVPQAVASGAVDMGMSTTARFAGTIPAIEIFYVPFATGNREKSVAMLQPGAALRTMLDDALLKTGTRPVWWIEYGRAVFVSKKENPVRVPSDLKGLKVRVFGKTLGDFVKANGGAATLMSGSRQFVAYQRGTVDAGMTGVASVKSRKLHEVMDVVTISEHAYIYFVSLINEKKWQSLSKSDQAAMTKCGRAAEKAQHEAVETVEAASIKFTREKGKQVIELSPAEVAQWRASGKPVVDAYLKNSGELGQMVMDALNK